MKIISPHEIPKAKKLGKTSNIPTLLKQIPTEKCGAISNLFTRTSKTIKGKKKTIWLTEDKPRIATIRSFIEKAHKNNEFLNFSIEQRSTMNTDGTKTVTLYVVNVEKAAR